MALGNADFSQLFSTTLQKYEKVLADNIIKTHPTLELFKQEAKSYTGRGLVIPVRAANLGATAYDTASGSGGYSTSVSSDTIGAVIFDWSNTVLTPYRVKHKDLLQNTGPEQVVSLVEEYVKGATADHQDFIVAELWASSSSTGDILALNELVRASDTTSTTAYKAVGGVRGGLSDYTVTNIQRSGANVATITVAEVLDVVVGDVVTVAGIGTAGFNAVDVTVTVVSSGRDAFSYANTGSAVSATASTGTVTCAAIKSFWRATEKTIAKTGGSSKDILAAFRETVNAIYAASRKRPTHIIAGFDVYEEFEAYLQDKGRYDVSKSMNSAETRFREISFDGIIVRLDPDAPVNVAYFLHAPALRFGYLAGEFMKAYPADRIQGTLDEVVPIASTLSIGTSERRAHGKLTRN
jgi:hypothetical protein